MSVKTSALLILSLLICGGCTQTQVREQTATDKVDKVTISGTVTIPTADGPRAMPIAFVVDRQGSEDQRRESDSRSSVDGAAIGREIAAVIGPVLAGATGGGLSWTSILAGVASTATVATTGYLALAKRNQMKLPSKS